jgi:hypothetical protein
MCQCENVANAKNQYPIRIATLVIGNIGIGCFHIFTLISLFPVPPLTQPAYGRTQKLRQNRCGYDAARGGYATIAFAASPFSPREDRLWRRA